MHPIARVHRTLRSHLGAVVAVCLLTFLVTGVASATEAGPGTVIHACVGRVTGIVRVVDQHHGCNPHLETPLSWNQQGPPGPPGPPAAAAASFLTFGYPSVGSCGAVSGIGVPSPDPCPFQLITAPHGASVTFVLNDGTPYGYCVSGLHAVPTSIIGSVGTQQNAADGSLVDLGTSLDGQSIEIQPPPAFCPAGSQIIVRAVSEDSVGGLYCEQVSCAAVVYRLVLG